MRAAVLQGRRVGPVLQPSGAGTLFVGCAMPYASYQIRRLSGLVWAWRADYRGETSQSGYALGRAAARRAARSWLRRQRLAAAAQSASSDRLHAPVD